LAIVPSREIRPVRGAAAIIEAKWVYARGCEVGVLTRDIVIVGRRCRRQCSLRATQQEKDGQYEKSVVMKLVLDFQPVGMTRSTPTRDLKSEVPPGGAQADPGIGSTRRIGGGGGV
jgi:hypothetical protein